MAPTEETLNMYCSNVLNQLTTLLWNLKNFFWQSNILHWSDGTDFLVPIPLVAYQASYTLHHILYQQSWYIANKLCGILKPA